MIQVEDCFQHAISIIWRLEIMQYACPTNKKSPKKWLKITGFKFVRIFSWNMGRLTRMASTRSRIDFDPREEPIDKSKLVSTALVCLHCPLSVSLLFVFFFFLFIFPSTFGTFREIHFKKTLLFQPFIKKVYDKFKWIKRQHLLGNLRTPLTVKTFFYAYDNEDFQ